MDEPKTSGFFKKKAKVLLTQPVRLGAFIHLATERLKQPGRTLQRVKDELATMLRLVKAWRSGDYRKVSWTSLVRIIACLLYFVAIIDIVPDFIFGVGLVDDLAVVVWTWRSLQDELQAFRNWEHESIS